MKKGTGCWNGSLETFKEGWNGSLEKVVVNFSWSSEQAVDDVQQRKPGYGYGWKVYDGWNRSSKQVVGNWLSSSLKEEGNGSLERVVIKNIQRQLKRVDGTGCHQRSKKAGNKGCWNSKLSSIFNEVWNEPSSMIMFKKGWDTSETGLCCHCSKKKAATPGRSWNGEVFKYKGWNGSFLGTGNCSNKKAGMMVRWNRLCWLGRLRSSWGNRTQK